MSVLLRTFRDLATVPAFDTWAHIPDGEVAAPSLEPARRRPGLGADLEAAFEAEAPIWWDLGRDLSSSPSAVLAHTPACVANVSDLGQMLAWTRLLREWAAESHRTLVVCDDPWMYRHLKGMRGIEAGRAPALWPRAARLWLRGYAARTRAALRFAAATRALKPLDGAEPGGAWLLVYGHPASTADGNDGYFGGLMGELRHVRRVLHVDCPTPRARQLSSDGRTESLHAHGTPWAALRLPFARWKPSWTQRRGRHGWLVRRAAAREGGTGQGAAIAWQRHCHGRWLARRRPAFVAWPWENHAWERAFVRVARASGVRTVGYQHSVIGRHMLNYAATSNPDGLDSFPDRIPCSGRATRDRLRGWGVPEDRLAIGGALRFPRRAAPRHDPSAPVFLALPFDKSTAAQMVAAARAIAGPERRFLVRDHPMTPFPFEVSDYVKKSPGPLEAQEAIAAVVFAATTVGLEAVLAGLPTLRFRPAGRMVLDILPEGIMVPAVDSETLADSLDRLAPPPPVDSAQVFAPADWAWWRHALSPQASKEGCP